MLIYYILTKGKHPFAPDDKYDKVESNILEDKYDLSALSDPLARNFVKDLLAADPGSRPSAEDRVRWVQSVCLLSLGGEPVSPQLFFTYHL